MNKTTTASSLFLAVLVVSTGTAQAQEGDQFGDLLELFIPALSRNSGPAHKVKPHLVRKEVVDGKTVLRRMWPARYHQRFDSIQKLVDGTMPQGLLLKTVPRSSKITIEGAIVSDRLLGYALVTLQGKEEEPGFWHGSAKLMDAGLFRLCDVPIESKWSMQQARKSLVYERMLDLLRFIKREVVESKRQPLNTKDDYLAFLRTADFVSEAANKDRKYPIAEHFRNLTMTALERGDIEFDAGKFSLAERIRQATEKEPAPRKIDINVHCKGSFKAHTTSQREMKSQPRYTARYVKYLASKSTKERKQLLDRGDVEFIQNTGYEWDELAVIPGVAFLAEHMAAVPEDLREGIAKGYIRDDSLKFFPDMGFDEIARIPKPVLLVACLPHMKEQDAVKMAETQRVKKLLGWAKLGREQLDGYSIPKFMARLVEKIEDKNVDVLLEIPEMKEYLRDTNDKVLKEAVKSKSFQLQ